MNGKVKTFRSFWTRFIITSIITCVEDSTTIAMVILVLKELELHLEETKKTAIDTGVTMMANKMLADMNRRFQFITDTISESFDPIFVTSTFFKSSIQRSSF